MEKYLNEKCQFEHLTNIPRSNILLDQFQFQSFCQEYYRPSQQYIIEFLSINGLNKVFWHAQAPAVEKIKCCYFTANIDVALLG